MKPTRIWPTVMAMLLLAACQQGGKDAETGDEEETPAVPVEVSTATYGDIYARYSGTAPIEAFQHATVIAKTGGEVREILVEEGDDVEAGDILARLDGDRLRLELAESEARLQKLQRDYQRNVDLKERGLISEGDFEKIKYEMDALEAANNLAKLELSYTAIRAPITGVISERFIKIGNTIDVNAETFEVTSLEPLVAYLHVPEREYRRIVKGQAAGIAVDALQGAEFPAVVARTSPVVDPETGTFKITIEVKDESRQLKPGMFGRISIVYDKHENAMQVPRSAIVAEAGEAAVFVVENDVAQRRIVQTGFTEKGRIEIIDGISDTDRFVIVGQTGLKNGSKVSVINDPDSGERAASNDAVSN
ncbi:MAG: efflux RND transporter periplasmic adaptor subunit [Gammaproteobacteria bacterium]|nr:efflux RND transporter periplasmic adaptor subunit [Gammaproteobacteria bacterium]